MVVVLIGMAVATMIFLSVLKLIAVQRQSVELQTRQIQAGWLAESAVQRASARLAADGSYRGETWNISAKTSADATVPRSRSGWTTSPASPSAEKSTLRLTTPTILSSGPGKPAT